MTLVCFLGFAGFTLLSGSLLDNNAIWSAIACILVAFAFFIATVEEWSKA